MCCALWLLACASPSVLFLGCLMHMGSGPVSAGSPPLGAAFSYLGFIGSNLPFLPFLFCFMGLFKVFTDSKAVSPRCFLKLYCFVSYI